MKYFVAIAALIFVVSCGAQSDPLRPTGNIGLSIGPNGVTPSASVGAQSGPLSVSVGL